MGGGVLRTQQLRSGAMAEEREDMLQRVLGEGGGWLREEEGPTAESEFCGADSIVCVILIRCLLLHAVPPIHYLIFDLFSTYKTTFLE